jgi:hypothetical protein
MRQTDDRSPHWVVITEAAPAALAGANTGRSPRLKPHRHCRSARSPSRRVGPRGPMDAQAARRGPLSVRAGDQ